MLRKILTIIADPTRVYYYLITNIKLYFNKNIVLKGRVSVVGMPLIDIRKGGTLTIGENVTLNSKNKGYHVGLFSPVKLFVDKPNAKIHIGDNTRIHGSCIHAYKSIHIGSNCLIAANCHIVDNNGHDLSFSDVDNRINTTGTTKSITIEDSVWICANTIVLPGVKIGKGAVISANSVVINDIPPMVLAGGNPAVIIKKY